MCGRKFSIKTVVMTAKQMVRSSSSPPFLSPFLRDTEAQKLVDMRLTRLLPLLFTAHSRPNDPREEPNLSRHQARQLPHRSTRHKGR
jgi:hypothetical protein